MKKIDLTGQIFDRLKVLKEDGMINGNRRWLCKCECGNTSLIFGQNLKRGTSKSCGCMRKEIMSLQFLKHGKRNTSTYVSWSHMKDRCNNSNFHQYKDYGGRGITYCKRWEQFENFYADMGDRPKGKTLDRIDNDGNYEPGNCRWATRIEQNNNKGEYVKWT